MYTSGVSEMDESLPFSWNKPIDPENTILSVHEKMKKKKRKEK
jgi:hypothetical protein